MHTQKHKISRHAPSIFQGRLNLAAAAKPHVALSIEYAAERVIMRSLVALLVALALLYLYFVSASVVNIMARKEALAQSGQIEGSIGSLEGQYFSLSQAITPQAEAALGLVPVTNTAYVDRPNDVGIADISR